MNKVKLKRVGYNLIGGATQWIWDLALMPYKKLYSFNVSPIFDGKRVAIIGAADSALNTNLGSYIDDFDLIIRVNRGPLLADDPELQKHIGTRTDVLFSYDNLGKYDAAIDDRIFKSLKKQQLKHLVVIMLWHKFSGRGIYLFFNKYLPKLPGAVRYHFFSRKDRSALKTLLAGKTATTGFAAIYAVLQSGCKECYITGFTFFQTNYMSGYRDNANSIKNVLNTFEHVGLHDPNGEFNVFKELVLQQKQKVKVDAYLSKILNHDEQ